MKTKALILALSIHLLCGIKTKAQDFPVYEALPVIPGSIPAPVQIMEMPRMNHRVHQQSTDDEEFTVISTFIIETATIDGKNYSQHYINNEACILIYTTKGSNQTFFATCMPVSKSISTGIMDSPGMTTQPNGSGSYNQKTYQFKWPYSNSYDDKRGIANVHLLQIFQKDATLFSCTISTKDNFIKFTGHMERSN
jgi:hypothetical protein